MEALSHIRKQHAKYAAQGYRVPPATIRAAPITTIAGVARVLLRSFQSLSHVSLSPPPSNGSVARPYTVVVLPNTASSCRDLDNGVAIAHTKRVHMRMAARDVTGIKHTHRFGRQYLLMMLDAV